MQVGAKIARLSDSCRSSALAGLELIREYYTLIAEVDSALHVGITEVARPQHTRSRGT
jgi:hypothetical protein